MPPGEHLSPCATGPSGGTGWGKSLTLTVVQFIQSIYILTALKQELEMSALLFRKDIYFQSPVLDMFVNTWFDIALFDETSISSQLMSSHVENCPKNMVWSFCSAGKNCLFYSLCGLNNQAKKIPGNLLFLLFFLNKALFHFVWRQITFWVLVSDWGKKWQHIFGLTSLLLFWQNCSP